MMKLDTRLKHQEEYKHNFLLITNRNHITYNLHNFQDSRDRADIHGVRADINHRTRCRCGGSCLLIGRCHGDSIVQQSNCSVPDKLAGLIPWNQNERSFNVNIHESDFAFLSFCQHHQTIPNAGMCAIASGTCKNGTKTTAIVCFTLLQESWWPWHASYMHVIQCTVPFWELWFLCSWNKGHNVVGKLIIMTHNIIHYLWRPVS